MGGRTLFLLLILMVFAVVQSMDGQGKQIKYKFPQISWHGMQWLQLTMHVCIN